MLKKVLLGFLATSCTVSGALAQSPSATTPYTPFSNEVVYLSEITSVGIETKLSDGRVLKSPRHQVGGLATFKSSKCAGAGSRCVGLPVPSSATLYFHDSEFELDGPARSMFAVCRRTLESARSTDLIELRGDFEASENPKFIIFHNLKSCVVGRKKTS